MTTENKPTITIQATVNIPVEKVWTLWNTPEHIMQWNSASPDWHTPKAELDLRPGGKFSSRMEAKDGSIGFDFKGNYTEVIPKEKIAYTFGDRTAQVEFIKEENEIRVRIIFDAEKENSIEKQKEGWQAILDNFKKYVLSRE